jgi:hypothetical protein
MSAKDPTERIRNATLAADASWAQTLDWTARTAPAREARFRKYEDQVDPDRKLPPAERRKRALKAQQAFMRQISRRGAAATKRNAAERARKRRESAA